MENLRVALFVSELEDAYTNALCCGVAEASRELGYQLFIFPGKFLNRRMVFETIDRCDYQNNSLFHFLSEKQIDIAIVNLGNIASGVTEEEKKKFLDRIPVPVILVSDDVEGYSCVNYNNSTGSILGIEHLIHDHGKKYFGYISGPKQNMDAMERLRVFEQSMERNGISKEQYQVIEGDFTSNSMNVTEQLLDSFPQMDALVCGNDMMCYGAYQAFEKRGLVPGKDIAVMGFDDMPYSSQISPGLTTVRADSSLLGSNAVEMCEQVLQGELLSLVVDTSLVVRESCGCPKVTEYNQKVDTFRIQANTESFNNSLVNISNNILNYEEENDKIYTMILRSLSHLDIRSVYLYTYDREMLWKAGDEWDAPAEVRLRAYYRAPHDRIPMIMYQPTPTYYYPMDESDVKEIEAKRQLIAFEDIFSNEYMEESSGVWVLSLLYAGEIQYGFAMWEVDEEYFGYIGKLSYQISNAIKTNRLLHKKNKMARELKEKNAILEEVSKIDELTQIYNRRGFLDHMKRTVISEDYKGRQILAVYADMNDLKLVNDRYGHEEGDYALRSIAEILRDAVDRIGEKGEIGRIGGDEFCAYLISDEPDVEQKLRTAVEEITAELNAGNGKPYYVSMSVGTHLFRCEDNVNISFELEKADEQLYIYKRTKRQGIDK